jgi:uncharacterized RDD family membrane protein YckC
VSPLPGWYRDPAAPDTQRYWDGEQWVGEKLPADAAPPPGPPPVAPPPAAEPPPVAAPPMAAPQNPWISPGSPHQPGPGAGQPGPPFGQGPGQPGQPGQPLPPVPPGHIRLPGSTATIAIDVTRLAPLGLRLVARLIDILAVIVLCAIVSGYFWYQLIQQISPTLDEIVSGKETSFAFSDEANRLNLIILVITIGLWFAYEVPAIANSGQTLGKRMVGIRVIRVTDDQVLTFGQSIRRWLILMLPSPILASVCGLILQLPDLLWCTWDRPARQCLHDKAVASIVVRASSVPVAPAPPVSKSDLSNHR